MTNLDCSVASCLYNQSQCCCKGDIRVEGKDADSPQGTCCGSFREKKGDSYTNVAGDPSRSVHVACDAVNCVYNADYKCSADTIGISGSNACDCKQTECASFRKQCSCN